MLLSTDAICFQVSLVYAILFSTLLDCYVYSTFNTATQKQSILTARMQYHYPCQWPEFHSAYFDNFRNLWSGNVFAWKTDKKKCKHLAVCLTHFWTYTFWTHLCMYLLSGLAYSFLHLQIFGTVSHPCIFLALQLFSLAIICSLISGLLDLWLL